MTEYFKKRIMEGDVVYAPDQLEAQARMMVGNTGPNQRQKIMKSIIRKERKKAYSKILDDNMTRIQNDIDRIIASELMRLHDERQLTDPRLTDGLHGL